MNLLYVLNPKYISMSNFSNDIYNKKNRKGEINLISTSHPNINISFFKDLEKNEFKVNIGIGYRNHDKKNYSLNYSLLFPIDEIAALIIKTIEEELIFEMELSDDVHNIFNNYKFESLNSEDFINAKQSLLKNINLLK